jgi:hypothetical protein
MSELCVADIEGPWSDPNLESGLIIRCRENWNVPVTKVSNEILATFLRQKLALKIVIPEAQRRIDLQFDDDSEIYEGELLNALNANRT